LAAGCDKNGRAIAMIQPERVQSPNDWPSPKGNETVNWMQSLQRAEWNHALEYAIM